MRGRVWLGLLFLVLGISFFLHQAHIIDLVQFLSTGWPFIFIIIGVIQLLNRTYSSTISGLLFLLMGILFLVNEWYEVNLIPYVLPLIFIFIGLVIIFTRKRLDSVTHSTRELRSFALLGSASIKSRSTNLKGGSIVNVLGGSEIDLREAVILDEATIDLSCVLGGITIIVPKSVRVEVSGIPILGAWEDNTRIYSDDGSLPGLKINCLVVLGGVEFRN
ncbi:LiaF domain-containing protein [Virgibacillus soli]|uniref:LiaF-related protein n=1 Tax=Paracerasibacillus soli TaxID=480284 RepID=A0ABU5CNV6_9BACI|nr:LiaF domain-containing protein [Virgibacillus soli]MDY0407576.1 LiaF-related protein [Virgibacillus soli]